MAARTASLQLISKIHAGDRRALDTLLRTLHSAPTVTALIDSTGGAANDTLVTIGATNGSDVSATINNNFADLAAKFNALRSALITAGILP